MVSLPVMDSTPWTAPPPDSTTPQTTSPPRQHHPLDSARPQHPPQHHPQTAPPPRQHQPPDSTDPRQHHPNKRAVAILLKCFLVSGTLFTFVCFFRNFRSGKMPIPFPFNCMKTTISNAKKLLPFYVRII